jgi:alpha-galactosidase
MSKIEFQSHQLTYALSEFFTILITIAMLGCSQSQNDMVVQADGKIHLTNAQIEIQLDSELCWSIDYKKDGETLSICKFKEVDSLLLPSHFIKTNGQIISKFLRDNRDFVVKRIQTEFGSGRRFIFRGYYQAEDGLAIEKKLIIEFYDDFPDLAITYAEFKNNSKSQQVEFSEVWNSCLQLDASLIDSSVRPHELCAFYGTAGRPIPLIDGLIPQKLDIENFTGRPVELEGIKKGNGGLPLLDFWCRQMGIGIGCIEPTWKNLYLPIKVQKDGKVLAAIRELPGINLDQPLLLRPGDSYQTIKTFVVVHSLDFYHTALRYSQLMLRLGIDMESEYTADDYLPGWCSWNDYCTLAMASKKDVMLLEPLMNRLNELKQLGIKLIIFDAGWFNNQGDWMPNPDPRAFPGGEEQLKDVIQEIHRQGFEVMLWISFLTADPGSEVDKQHPEWMIQKPDGQNHLDRWSGHTMCPSLPEVQEYHRQLARRLVEEYGADAFKIDGMYTCPPCYNAGHQHSNPNQSCEDFYKVFQAFYQEAKSINPKVTVMECPCGTICSFATLPYVSQTIAADPPDYLTVRRYMKLYRALKGSDSPYSSDYTNVEEGSLRLPTAIGCGSVPQTFYGATPDSLTFNYYKKWFKIYNDEMISRSEYLNLYDIFYDQPETYVFNKGTDQGEIFYYSFFADDSCWEGKVQLRGLAKVGNYRVIDFVNNRELATVSGSQPEIHISFENYLLVKCIPQIKQ